MGAISANTMGAGTASCKIVTSNQSIHVSTYHIYLEVRLFYFLCLINFELLWNMQNI